MKKRFFLLFVAVTVIIVLATCGFVKVEQEEFNGFDPSSEIVEVFKSGESESMRVLSGAIQVKEYFSDLNFDDWEISRIADVSKAYSCFALFFCA